MFHFVCVLFFFFKLVPLTICVPLLQFLLSNSLFWVTHRYQRPVFMWFVFYFIYFHYLLCVCLFFSLFVCCELLIYSCGVQLEWGIGKVNPFVSRIAARLRPKAMPLNIVHDKDGLPRIILTEPTGSSAEVCFSIFFFFFFFLLRKEIYGWF